MAQMRKTIILLICAILAGCSTEKRQPHQPDTLIIAIDQTPVNLDPRIGIDKSSEDFHHLLFNGLLKKNENDRMVPDLAQSWERVNSKLYRFFLRDGIRFHNGRSLQAQDVVFTYRSILSGKVMSTKKSALESISDVRATAKNIVEVELNQPFNGLIYNMNIGIVPENSTANFAQNPIGTGPYRLISYQSDGDALLKSFPEYFEGPARIQNLKIRIIPDATTRALEIRKGSIDLILGPSAVPPDYYQVLRSDPELKTLTRTGNNYAYIGFNVTDRLLSKREVRQAISYAIEREQMMQSLFYGTATVATGLLPPHNWAYERNVLPVSYDRQNAMKLLDRAGLTDPDGDGPEMRFWLTLKTSTSEFRKIVATVVQRNLASVGIGLKIRSYEFGTYFSDINRGNFQMCMLMWIGESDPDIFSVAFSTKGSRNRGKYSNSDVDRWIEMARVADSEDEQIKLYSLIQKRIAEDAPYVSLWYEPNICIMRKELQGMRLTPDSDFRVLKDVYWAERK
jgi:peptide/nickel transport system substrate-binding protein